MKGKLSIFFVCHFTSDAALSGHCGSPEVEKVLQTTTFSCWVKQYLGTDHVVTKSKGS